MQYADIIAREADSLPLAKQAEVLDFIKFLKTRQGRAEDTTTPGTTEEIEAFFRSFKVDTSGYKFDRDEANVR
ncbi:MAG: hypothetical protein Q8O64_02950 [Sideroxyarcus sp.]|nr:hypothetical protein [Sideroxyarcus sp.]